jgi:hypothetical protein
MLLIEGDRRKGRQRPAVEGPHLLCGTRSCGKRPRPVLMTTLVAMLGLLPAAVSTAIGAQTQKPLAVVVISRSVIRAVLTRVLHPPLPVLAHQWMERRHIIHLSGCRALNRLLPCWTKALLRTLIAFPDGRLDTRDRLQPTPRQTFSLGLKPWPTAARYELRTALVRVLGALLVGTEVRATLGALAAIRFELEAARL